MTSLVKKIDQRINEASGKYRPGQRLGAFVMVPDAPALADQLRSLAQQQSLRHVNLSIGVAPPRYEINKEAFYTIVIYTPGRPGQNKVVANFALRECDLDDTQTDAILTALSSVLPK